MFEFRTLGTIDLRTGAGDRVASLLDQPKRLALLAILSARPRGELLRREELLALLWPEDAPSAGRSSLSTTLSRLRRDLGEEIFRGTGTGTIGLSPSYFRSDVQQFLEAVHEDRHRRAAELYRGPFMEGFGLSGNRSFQEWLENRRTRLRRQAYGAALEAGGKARAEGKPGEAEAAFRKALEIDPYQEVAAVALLRVLNEQGSRSEALRFYRDFSERIEGELDLAPSDRLREAAKRTTSDSSSTGAGSAPSGTGPPAPDAKRNRAGDGEEEDVGAGEGVPPRAGSGRSLLRGAPRLRLLVVALIVLGVAGATMWVWRESDSPASVSPSSPTGRPSVAVLPFEAAGPGTETWREGMVTVLSTALDGVATFRTLPDRTVFSAARSADGIEAESGSRRRLVADRIGADYTVSGTAVSSGESLELTAHVHAFPSGERLGRAVIRGAADSALVLTNELAVRVLEVLLEDDRSDLPDVELGDITTRSLPALKYYLSAERRFRSGDYEAAVEGYRMAIARDSTFALAYSQLAQARAWGGHSGGWRDPLRRAYELSDQLPTRQRRLVWTRHAWDVTGRTLGVVDSLRRLSESYPDDPEVWYQLGEVLFHGYVPRGWEEAEEAFERASELAGGVAPYHQHLMDLAMALHQDSALTARRIAAHPEGPLKRVYRVLSAVNFGSAERRKRAFRRLDSVPLPDTEHPYWVRRALSHPTDLALQTRVLRILANRPDTRRSAYQVYQAINRLRRGQVTRAVPAFGDLPSWASPGCRLAAARSLGYPVPDSTLARFLVPPRNGSAATPRRLVCVGIYLLETGRAEQVGSLADAIQEAGVERSASRAEADARMQVAMNELRGYRHWKADRLTEAARNWSASMPRFWEWGAIWRGDLHRQLGEQEKALSWYRAGWIHPVAHERLGQLYEELGRPEEAADAYRRFIAAWEDADEALQDRVEDARRRLEALGGSRPESGT